MCHMYSGFEKDYVILILILHTRRICVEESRGDTVCSKSLFNIACRFHTRKKTLHAGRLEKTGIRDHLTCRGGSNYCARLLQK
jgi:hypothetical protein